MFLLPVSQSASRFFSLLSTSFDASRSSSGFEPRFPRKVYRGKRFIAIVVPNANAGGNGKKRIRSKKHTGSFRRIQSPSRPTSMNPPFRDGGRRSIGGTRECDKKLSRSSTRRRADGTRIHALPSEIPTRFLEIGQALLLPSSTPISVSCWTFPDASFPPVVGTAGSSLTPDFSAGENRVWIFFLSFLPPFPSSSSLNTDAL